MFKTLQNAFRIKEIRDRILYVLLMMVVIRVGSQLPIPGVNGEYIQQWFALQSNDAFNFFSAFTGGSFEQMSLFALNITPYITSSIIIQLLTIAIPALEEMRKDGEEGKKKMTAITRVLTIGLSLFQSVAMVIAFGRQGLIEAMVEGSGASTFEKVMAGFIAVACLTAGSALLMWIGERITVYGIGNGISVVLAINIISSIPSDIVGLFQTFVKGNTIAKGAVAAVVIVSIILLLVVFVLILNGGVRKIPVQYSKKMHGRKMVGGQSSTIPMKVNTAGVIPIIFASSLMSFPVVIASFAGAGNGDGIGSHILKALSSNNWCNPSQPVYSIGLLVYIVLVVFFAYFYTSITFNPIEIADNIKKQGGNIPGIRPGKATSDYLNKLLNYIIFIGATGLIIVAIIPIIFNGLFGASVSFGGTSIIIVVGVILETLKQIEAKMLVRNYKGFLNN